jgi:RND family efflux transporter MFP subunit
VKKTTPLIAALIGALALTGGCVDREKQVLAAQTEKVIGDPTVSVSLGSAVTKTLVQTDDVTGNITTADDTEIGAKQSGRIVAVYVRDGDSVSAGEIVARQDTVQLRAQLRQAIGQLQAAQGAEAQAKANAAFGPQRSSAAVLQAQAALRSAKAALAKELAGARPEERAQAQANLDAAKTNLDTAKKDLARKQALVAEGALAKTTLDLAQNAYATALQQYNNALQAELETEHGNRQEDVDVANEAVRQANESLKSAQASQRLDVTFNDAVRSADAQVESARALVEVAKANLSDADIRAPFSGKISGNPVQTGTVVGSGGTVARLIGGQGAYFEGDVPEEVIDSVKIGAPIEVSVDALPQHHFSGTVAAVNPLGSDIGRQFKVRITLAGDLAGVRANMFAHGKLVVKSVPDAVVVPSTAVLGTGSNQYVYTVEGNKAKKLKVTTGLLVKDEVQVSGIAAGTMVVVYGQTNLIEGTPVKVVDQNGTTPKPA